MGAPGIRLCSNRTYGREVTKISFLRKCTSYLAVRVKRWSYAEWWDCKALFGYGFCIPGQHNAAIVDSIAMQIVTLLKAIEECKREAKYSH